MVNAVESMTPSDTNINKTMSNNIQEIKKRIRSTNNTAKITKAMQLVSAARMKKINERFGKSQYYLNALREILTNVYNSNVEIEHEFFKEFETKKNLVILVGTDKGLVGGLTSRLGARLYSFTNELTQANENFEIITVKKKALGLAKKFKLHSSYHFEEAFEAVDSFEMKVIKDLIVDKFKEGFNHIYVIYPKFVSSLIQEIEVEKILPLNLEDIVEHDKKSTQFIFEPDVNTIIDKLLNDYLDNKIIDILLSSAASEYSARMIAMNKASDNATNVSKKLNLQFNKSRQQLITEQLQENLNASLI
jgi:F-type H+-transporting ATPase subunit gamma